MLVNQCPFGGCNGGNASASSTGQPNNIVINNNGGQCQCCENKQQQPIIINNIIPAAEVLKAAGAVQLTPQQAATIAPVTLPAQTPVQPIINVHVPPQAAPQVNLSMPDIQMPSINVHVPPQGTPSGTASSPPSATSSAAPPSTATSSPPSGATSSAAPSQGTTSGATDTPDVEKLDTAQILKEIESLKTQLMPFYDANTNPSAVPTLPGANAPANGGAGYGSHQGCCIPNIHVNVSPRFNQQLLASARDGAPTRYGYSTEGSAEATGQQAGQATGTTAQQPAQPTANVSRPTQNQGMQTAPRTNSTCDECEEEDDDGIEFYINDRKRVKRQPALSNRFIALPKAPPREFA